MAANDESETTFNYSSVSYPSDGLTVNELRRRFPLQIDTEGGIEFFLGEEGQALDDMLYHERLIARGAFFGCPPDCTIPGGLALAPDEIDRIVAEEERMTHENLEEYYQLFGLADGPVTAKMLIEKLKFDAAKTRNAHPGVPGR
jgi:hypothetical protein